MAAQNKNIQENVDECVNNEAMLRGGKSAPYCTLSGEETVTCIYLSNYKFAISGVEYRLCNFRRRGEDLAEFK